MRKAASGKALAAVIGLAASFYLCSPGFAEDPVDAAALTQCLIANTTDDHIAAMKKLMIAALSDDIAGLKAEATNYGNIIVQMAMSSCKITLAQLSDPAVNEAVGKYGEALGAKIMTDAFAKIQ
jgi:NaMN:DMB phosphoribosyltransferase